MPTPVNWKGSRECHVEMDSEVALRLGKKVGLDVCHQGKWGKYLPIGSMSVLPFLQNPAIIKILPWKLYKFSPPL